jgi:hypothetical protein
MAVGDDLRTRFVWLLVMILAVSGLGIAVPPSADASYYEHGVSFSGRIVRGSVPYRLNVKAIETMGFTHRLQVSVSKLADPSGPTRLRQTQTWIFDLQPEEFTYERTTYRIDAGSEEGPMHVQVTVEAGDDARCSERQGLFVKDDGDFRIETGNEVFGTITELPQCGQQYDHSSGQLPGPPPCPPESQEVTSESLSVKERRFGDVARVLVQDARQRDLQGHQVRWSLKLKGTLAANRFRLDDRLEGSLTADEPWLEGTAVVKGRERLTRGDWYDCRGGGEARTSGRQGEVTGDLTLDVIGYESYVVAARNAWALRTRVRPRR